MVSLVAVPGGWELVLVVLVILLLFGAKKLPELARGSGRALRIFKTETSGLLDADDLGHNTAPGQDAIGARRAGARPTSDDPGVHVSRGTAAG